MNIRWCFLIPLLAAFCVPGLSLADEIYTLGVGDRVRVMVYGEDDLHTEAEVAGNGTISIPLLGRVHVLDLSAREAAEHIESRLERGGFLQNAHVNVLVDEYRSNTLAVLGQVNQPGRLMMDGPMTLTEALALAGGVSNDGSERVILLRTERDGRQLRQEYNLRELLDVQADNSEQVPLRNGDTIYVPRADRFYVYGEVQEPGNYVLDRPLTVRQALSVGGGLSANASRRGLTVYRQQPDGSVEEASVGLDDRVQDGDVIFVRERWF
ncbi:MAG: SLBB domain-containing protein [Ectothiorhodospiraceae bacterium]|nr:SLBB domain-containing protein [Ectothiorhodospiraceae bacterium]MCH8504051.1 SLBB domain-containing protein [Ectothiorhodospiraceae bacterium]